MSKLKARDYRTAFTNESKSRLTQRISDLLLSSLIFTQSIEAHKRKALSLQACPTCGSNCRTVHPSVPYRSDGKYNSAPLAAPLRPNTPLHLTCLECGKLVGSSTYAKHLSGCMDIEKTNGKLVGTRKRKEVGYAEDSNSEIEEEAAPPQPLLPPAASTEDAAGERDGELFVPTNAGRISPSPTPQAQTVPPSQSNPTKRKKEKDAKSGVEKPPKKKRKTAKEKAAEAAAAAAAAAAAVVAEEEEEVVRGREDSGSASPPAFRAAVLAEPVRPTTSALAMQTARPMGMQHLNPFQNAPYPMWGSQMPAPTSMGMGPATGTERRESMDGAQEAGVGGGGGGAVGRKKKAKEDEDSDYVVSEEDSD
ncbi:hypothetical protein BT69DRAFT_1275804 [Atractiella rhizophila]|nr:hypothetical protein BT69DRAFT_1275804 [Atractiella rhizophila]